jgi:hypothetical protein
MPVIADVKAVPFKNIAVEGPHQNKYRQSGNPALVAGWDF